MIGTISIACECGRLHRISEGIRYLGDGKLVAFIKCNCGRGHVLSRRKDDNHAEAETCQ